MKKIVIYLILLTILISGCSKRIRSFEYRGVNYRYEEKLHDGTLVYTAENENKSPITIKPGHNENYDRMYEIQIENEEYTVTKRISGKIDIKYPNGQEGYYHRTEKGIQRQGVTGYETPDTIVRFVVKDQEKSRRSIIKINWQFLFYGLITTGVGYIAYVCPEIFWYLNSGWKYKNAEPSDFYKTLTSTCGILGMVVGGLMFIISFFT
ncbi:hypothetical protein EDC18_10121 [Natranaerovirga pectinivora]|uniref:DUF6199 domain-containing protein n=1 Tax=Natranaerovirga pectinivora TaxID=682400 RepID=A0A4R3MTT7_9FIRM|nr:DUF6199 family natural product biosynthesis protein [Natranaerovirga pectinivora]TCT16726.1 hypothetical protein EDC18_10121 [Natranaerovirga pectinivora]